MHFSRQASLSELRLRLNDKRKVFNQKHFDAKFNFERIESELWINIRRHLRWLQKKERKKISIKNFRGCQQKIDKRCFVFIQCQRLGYMKERGKDEKRNSINASSHLPGAPKSIDSLEWSVKWRVRLLTISLDNVTLDKEFLVRSLACLLFRRGLPWANGLKKRRMKCAQGFNVILISSLQKKNKRREGPRRRSSNFISIFQFSH